MYRLIVYNVIYVITFWITIINCLKGEKRIKGSKKTLKPVNPIHYETDPKVLEKERRQKIAENRAKMLKKRQKPMRKQQKIVEDEFKDATITLKKVNKEKEMLSEDSTQPSKSDESIETAHPAPQEKREAPKPENEKANRKQEEPNNSRSEEEIGNVQLVDQDPYAAAKKHIIKKRAQELARKRQMEDVMRKRQERENVAFDVNSPDDTLKNISSIQFESQLSVIQRKRKQMKTKDGSSEEALVEPKSNELYIRDMPERVME